MSKLFAKKKVDDINTAKNLGTKSLIDIETQKLKETALQFNNYLN